MTDRTIPTGIESAFIESWGGWDEIETMCLIFHDCIIKDVFALPTNLKYDVTVDCNTNRVEVYLREVDKICFSGKFSVKLIRKN